MAKIKSQCKANCSAANPAIHSQEIDSLPKNVQAKIKELGLELSELRRCSYCGSVWIAMYEKAGNGFRDRVIQVGNGMHWPILDRRAAS